MFYLRINPKNPFYKDRDDFEAIGYFHREGKLFGHKYFNIQLDKFDAWNLFTIDLDIEFSGCNHAGPSIELSILGYTFIASIYDHRHWDNETNDWCKPYEEVKEDEDGSP